MYITQPFPPCHHQFPTDDKFLSKFNKLITPRVISSDAAKVLMLSHWRQKMSSFEKLEKSGYFFHLKISTCNQWAPLPDIRSQGWCQQKILTKNTLLGNLGEDNDHAVVTLVCEDGQQVAVNCIYICILSICVNMSNCWDFESICL